MSFKILYAASERNGAKLQLCRFLENFHFDNCIIKLSGYKKMGTYLDWTLDALHDLADVEINSINNDNFEIYYEQIKYFSPNLIISDLEPYTSYIGYLLNVPVWQVSPLILNDAQYYGREIDITASRHVMFNKIKDNKLLQNIIFNADKKLVYSHFCDVENAPVLRDNYEWVRPYHYIGNKSEPCEHNIIAIIHNNVDKIIKSLKKQNDVVIFVDKDDINLNNSKNIFDYREYICNLTNSSCCINQGLTDILADAFYNKKYSIIMPDMFDTETILNSIYSSHYGLARISYDQQIVNEIKYFDIIYDDNVKFLHEKVFEVI